MTRPMMFFVMQVADINNRCFSRKDIVAYRKNE